MVIADLPFPKIGAKKKPYKLPKNLTVEQWVIPQGTTVNLFQSVNHGIVIIPTKCKDMRGFDIPQRVFKW